MNVLHLFYHKIIPTGFDCFWVRLSRCPAKGTIDADNLILGWGYAALDITSSEPFRRFQQYLCLNPGFFPCHTLQRVKFFFGNLFIRMLEFNYLCAKSF